MTSLQNFYFSADYTGGQTLLWDDAPNLALLIVHIPVEGWRIESAKGACLRFSLNEVLADDCRGLRQFLLLGRNGKTNKLRACPIQRRCRTCGLAKLEAVRIGRLFSIPDLFPKHVTSIGHFLHGI